MIWLALFSLVVFVLAGLVAAGLRRPRCPACGAARLVVIDGLRFKARLPSGEIRGGYAEVLQCPACHVKWHSERGSLVQVVSPEGRGGPGNDTP